MNHITTYLMQFLAILSFIVYGLSVFITFRTEESQKISSYKALKIFSILFWIYATVKLIKIDLHPYLSIMAIFIYSYALLVYFWTSSVVGKKNFSLAFSNDTPKYLVIKGPFNFVRNPFYHAYLISYFTTVLIVNSQILSILFFALLLLYISAIIQEEEKFHSSPLKEDYNEYQKKAKRLIPFIW